MSPEAPRGADRRRADAEPRLPAPAPAKGIAMLVLAAALAAACQRAATRPGPGDGLVVEVLPFEVTHFEAGADYLGNAFASSLALDLGHARGVHALSVPAAGSSPAPARRVAGTLTVAGDRVLARVELRDPSTRETLWRVESSSVREDLSGLAHRLARDIAGALGAAYPELYDYIGNVTGGREMSASPLAARAGQALRSGDLPAFLEAATDLAAQFRDEPAAHVLHAWALTLAWDEAPTPETLTRLRERLAELHRLDPASPYDEMLRGYVYRSSGEPAQARRLYSEVLSRDDLTDSARAWTLRQRSFASLQLGDASTAHADAAEAVRLDPLNPTGLGALSKALEALGRLDDSIVRARQALDLAPSWRHQQRVGLVASRAGRFDEAVDSLGRACRLGRNQEACANLAVALHRSGREAEARAAATEAGSLSANPWGSYNLACFWALTGDKVRSLRALRRAIELGYADVLIRTDPDFASLRSDPEFEAVVHEVDARLRMRRQQAMSSFPWQALAHRDRALVEA